MLSLARKIYNKCWRKANPEKTKASHEKWCSKNLDYYKNWRITNKKQALKNTRIWRAKNPEAVRRLRKTHYTRSRKYLENIKNKPCMDCGKKFSPCLMEFDHRDPKTKKGSVGGLFNSARIKLHQEIEKCDLVCILCHKNVRV